MNLKKQCVFAVFVSKCNALPFFPDSLSLNTIIISPMMEQHTFAQHQGEEFCQKLVTEVDQSDFDLLLVCDVQKHECFTSDNGQQIYLGGGMDHRKINIDMPVPPTSQIQGASRYFRIFTSYSPMAQDEHDVMGQMYEATYQFLVSFSMFPRCGQSLVPYYHMLNMRAWDKRKRLERPWCSRFCKPNPRFSSGTIRCLRRHVGLCRRVFD